MLIVGGGPNGVEYTGSLAEGYPDKKIGIVTRRPRLLPTMPPAASVLAEEHLKRQKVNLYLNTNYTADLKSKLKYDLVIDCSGS